MTMLRFILYSILIVPGLACGYVFWVRPVLEAMPAFKKFYTEADGFWNKVWAICGKSATMAWGYVLAGVGAAVQFIDPLASAVGDPNLHDQVTQALASDPKILGYFAMFVAAVTVASRLRTIGK
jgi:hypothetical protein